MTTPGPSPLPTRCPSTAGSAATTAGQPNSSTASPTLDFSQVRRAGQPVWPTLGNRGAGTVSICVVQLAWRHCPWVVLRRTLRTSLHDRVVGAARLGSRPGKVE